MKAPSEVPAWPSRCAVRAMTTRVRAREPLVMKYLLPLRRQPPASARAMVSIPAASLPAPGSLSAQAPTPSPRRSGSSACVFCVSSAKAARWLRQRVWASSVMVSDASTRASSSTTTR